MSVTVLTATLGRRPQMLAEAVASVAAQTFPPLEHLVVDDGSWAVEELPGTRVVRIERRGLGGARNAGLEQAEGDVIALLDDDDLWHPHHLQACWTELQRTGADVVYADCEEVGRRDGWTFSVKDFDAALLERENYLCVPATVVRTAALRDIGGFSEGPLEDWETWKRMARAGMRFVHLPQVTVTYRFHTDNLTYGGVDPELTRRSKELREAAERGEISWERFAELEAEVWQ
ncbi:MAG: glycosyltransferase family 2 protein [Mycobacteriales bacterium]